MASGSAGDLLLPLLRKFPPGWLRSSYADPRHENNRAAPPKKVCRRKSRNAFKQYGDGALSRALSEVAGAALQASHEYQEALWGRGRGGGSFPGGVCGHGDPGLHGKGPLPRFQRWGNVGVLNISVASSQVDKAVSGREEGEGLLSEDTWTWLKDFFRAPEICLQVRLSVKVLTGPVCERRT